MADSDITRLLHAWRSGNRQALDDLVPLVHDELQRLAHHYMKGEKSGHTLQTTALINEAYLRLVGADVEWRDRVHFFAVAAGAMRRILVDHARARDAAKRGGGAFRITLGDDLAAGADGEIDMIDLDRALASLQKHDERKARIIELHYFGGLTIQEISRLLEISSPTVGRDLRFARAYLKTQMTARH